jgi:hypothetical protein
MHVAGSMLCMGCAEEGVTDAEAIEAEARKEAASWGISAGSLKGSAAAAALMRKDQSAFQQEFSVLVKEGCHVLEIAGAGEFHDAVLHFHPSANTSGSSFFSGGVIDHQPPVLLVIQLPLVARRNLR